MEPIASNVTELELADGVRIFIAPTKAKDVVTLQGSVLGGMLMLPRGKEITQALAVELLDAGTVEKTKDQIREALAARGIGLSFSSGTDRTFFSGSCLPEDFSFLLKTIVECLTGATFPTKEIALAKERMRGELEEGKTDTNFRATIALSRMMYDPSHINYADTIEERIKFLNSITRAELLAFRKMLGREGLVISVAGDITPASAERSIRSAIEKLPKGTTETPVRKLNQKRPEAKELLVPITDKANIDTYLGVALPINYDHPLYLAFTIFNSMLGARGLSSGHLMSTIRERDGLTYGIYVRAGGFGALSEGFFRIWATFSPATFKVAVEKTRKEISIFLKTKLTEQGLLARQDQFAGSYVVGLSTTNGLASTLHSIGIEGKPLSYIDAYPDLIRAVTLDDLKAVAKLIPFDKLSLAASGSFDTKAK
ncbi:MAG: Zinc protease [Parcubacteria group bacterium]|nr:Zinc protease [Parcubacteria group bacterium]